MVSAIPENCGRGRAIQIRSLRFAELSAGRSFLYAEIRTGPAFGILDKFLYAILFGEKNVDAGLVYDVIMM